MKKISLNRHPYKTLFSLSLIVIILLVTVLIGYGLRIRSLNNGLNGSGNLKQQQEEGLAWFPVKVYVQDAIKGLYANQGVINPTDNKIYFPELRVYLPFSQPARQLRYQYSDALHGQPATAQFMPAANLNHLIRSFDDVSCLQKVATLSVDKPADSDESKAGTIKLHDGRSLYFYKNNAQNCIDFWGSNISQQTVDLLKQAQSY